MSWIATNPSAACDVVALGDESAEQAVVRRRRQGFPPSRPRSRGRTGPAHLGIEQPRVYRRRTPGPGDRRGRGRRPHPDAQRRRTLVRQRAQPALRSFFTSTDGVAPRRWTCRVEASTGTRGRFVIPAARPPRGCERTPLVLARKADDDIGREIEVARAGRASRGTAPTSSGVASRGARRRRPDWSGTWRWGEAVGSRGAPRRGRARGGSPRSTRAAAARRPGSSPPRGRAAAACIPPRGRGSSRG